MKHSNIKVSLELDWRGVVPWIGGNSGQSALKAANEYVLNVNGIPIALVVIKMAAVQQIGRPVGEAAKKWCNEEVK